jgi:hypothetical protein
MGLRASGEMLWHMRVLPLGALDPRIREGNGDSRWHPIKRSKLGLAAKFPARTLSPVRPPNFPLLWKDCKMRFQGTHDEKTHPTSSESPA